GMSILAMAIMAPGMFLSQPPTASTPSILWAPQAVSIESAMTSRETREYFMPSVPIEIPSLTVTVPKVCGMAPAWRMASSARWTSRSSPALHGVMVLCALAIPMIGLPKSSSPKPTARSMARLGARSTPWVMALLRSWLGIRGMYWNDGKVGKDEGRRNRPHPEQSEGFTPRFPKPAEKIPHFARDEVADSLTR